MPGVYLKNNVTRRLPKYKNSLVSGKCAAPAQPPGYTILSSNDGDVGGRQYVLFYAHDSCDVHRNDADCALAHGDKKPSCKHVVAGVNMT